MDQDDRLLLMLSRPGWQFSAQWKVELAGNYVKMQRRPYGGVEQCSALMVLSYQKVSSHQGRPAALMTALKTL